jgi:hypothetical protein
MQMPPHCSLLAGNWPMSCPLKSQSLSKRVKPFVPTFQLRADTVVIDDTAAINRTIDETFNLFQSIKKNQILNQIQMITYYA